MTFLEYLRAQHANGPCHAPVHEHTVERRETFTLGPSVYLEVVYADLEGTEVVEAVLREPGQLTLLDGDDLKLLCECGILKREGGDHACD